MAASGATATVTEGLARSFAQMFGLAIHAPPLALDTFELSILRSGGGPPDPALDWLEGAIVDAREGVPHGSQRVLSQSVSPARPRHDHRPDHEA